MDRNDVPELEGRRNELTWEMVGALEEVLDHWEETHSPLGDAGLQKYMLARRPLNHLRAELPAREAQASLIAALFLLGADAILSPLRFVMGVPIPRLLTAGPFRTGAAFLLCAVFSADKLTSADSQELEHDPDECSERWGCGLDGDSAAERALCIKPSPPGSSQGSSTALPGC